MADFGSKSRQRLETLHPELQQVLLRAIKITDFMIVCGHRDEDAQMEAFRGGFSRKRWGESTHNKYPSDGVDLAPFPVRWDDIDRFCYLAGVVMSVAHEMGIQLRWGGDWDGDGFTSDHRLKDYGHFERVDTG